jgi:glycosyltransferase involved in cell wall biosynthesis
VLAVIIPFYKINFFNETLQSLANQTNKQFKVYIGDDASPDDVSELLLKFKGKFDFEYYRFSNNLGQRSLVKQWERCVDLAKEEKWLMILGDDDVLQDNCISSFYENLCEIEKQDIKVVRYATVVIDKGGNEITKVHTHPQLELSIDFLMRKFKGGTRSSLSEYIFKLEDLKRIKFKDLPLAWYSDLLAVLEVSNFGNILTINNSKVYFRLSGQNITSQTDNLILKNIGTFQFYQYLLNVSHSFFTKDQEEQIVEHYEKTFLDNKKNKTFWIDLTQLYLRRAFYKRYFIVLTKAINSAINNLK